MSLHASNSERSVATKRRPLLLRVLGWLCVALLGLELLYVVAANVFLNANGLALAFATTNQVNAKISGGWTVLPGHVHVRNARVTFQDQNLQFSIDLARVSLALHLGELIHHRFHASRVRGEGVSFHLRHRVDPRSKNEPSVGTFPPFPEFPGPAVFEATVPEAPVSDAAYSLWTVHLDDVDVKVSEIWAQAFRYRGQGRARGAFELRPARTLWVGPATLELEPGSLVAGAYNVAPRLHGSIACTVHPFDVREPQGMQVLRYVSARVRLDAPSVDPQVYALFSSAPSAPRVSSAGGPLHVDIETRRGVISAASTLELVQHNFELRAGEGELDAQKLEVRATAEGEASGQLTVTVERGTFKEPIAPGYPPSIEHAQLALVTENRDLTRPFELAEVRLPELRLTLGDSSWLNRWVKGRNFSLTGGAVSLMARGYYRDHRVTGDAWLESQGVRGVVMGRRAHYAGALALQGKQVDPEAFTGQVDAVLTGRSLRSEFGTAGELNLAGLRVRVAARRDAQGNDARGEAELSALSTSQNGVVFRAPRVLAFARTEQSGAGAQITHFSAQIPTLSADGRGVRLTTGAMSHGTLVQPKSNPDKRLEFWATLLGPRALFGARPVTAATQEQVQMHAALRSDAQHALSGSIDLSPAAWQVDASNLRFSGKSALGLRLAALNLQNNSGEIDAHLGSTGVTFGDTTQNADCPWSRVETLALDATTRLLERGGAALSLRGDFRQAELDWGDFLTHGDIGLDARFDPGLLSGDGKGALELSFRNAVLRSGGGGERGWAATVPLLDLHATLARASGKMSGEARLNAESARGRIGATPLATDFSADFALDTLDLDARSAHGSGNVHVRNTALPNAPDPISKWWADIKVDSIFGHAAQNLELGGMFRANLRDATPGLAVLASQGSLPKWVASAFPLRDLSITGSVARRCRLTDIRVVQMSGGPALARGRLQSLPEGFEGALLLRLADFKAISAGVDFDAKHTNFALFHGDDWLLGQNRSFDRKSERATKLSCPPDPDRCTEPAPVSVADEADQR